MYDGDTEEQDIETDLRKKQTLTDEQILHLVQIGRKIEAHFGCPQDIEWALLEIHSICFKADLLRLYIQYQI